MLDAPVSGGEAGAIAATLSIMVGGAADDFAAARRFSRRSGKTIVHVGPSGAGQTVKAANQLIVAGNIELLAEAVAFVEAYGVDTEAALQVLGGGLAGSKVLDQKGANMLGRDVPARLPDRPAPQGSGHRDHGRRAGGRSGDPARRGGRPADGVRGRARRRRPGPFRPAARRTRLSGRDAEQPPRSDETTALS